MPDETEVRDPRAGMFVQTVVELAYGEGTKDFDEALAEVVDACVRFQKKGSLTVTLNMNPENGTMIIEYGYKATIPQRDHNKTIMYVQNDGALTRRDPRQPPLPFDVVQPTASDADGNKLTRIDPDAQQEAANNG